MSEPFIGEVRMFGFNFAPVGWQFCDGSLLQIADYDALFMLIGTTYGGDGMTTFAVPDLRGRAPLHQGTGFGLTGRVLGEIAGSESVTLSAQQLPAHAHALMAATSGTRSASAAGNMLGSGEADIYNRDNGHNQALSAAQVAASGGSQPHENMQPSLCVNFCISLFGIFPSQN
ncbi:MAG: phage tail protein [Dokdonella sp.]|uniref:phage tail protein n=1 Tax=Dokdonella sp. TaxID=2291710 RepID=UPI0025BEEC05|nr:tail fiber protein [Dokdonella sp.]MBZ0223839.1 tail fiber protein [Dokdonella sp.]MCC7254953.1 phage tail protein [Dokdonella sp.]